MKREVAKKLFTLKKDVNFVVNLEVSNFLGKFIFQRIDGKDDVYSANTPFFYNINAVMDAVIWQPADSKYPVLEFVLEVDRNGENTIESLNLSLGSNYDIYGFYDQETLKGLYAKEDGWYKFPYLIDEFKKAFTTMYILGITTDEHLSPAEEHESRFQQAGSIDMELFEQCDHPFNKMRNYNPYEL